VYPPHVMVPRSLIARRAALAAGTVTLILAATGCANSSASSTAASTVTSPPADLAPNATLAPPLRMPGWRRVFADNFTQDVPVGSFPSAVSTTWFAYRDGLKDTSNHGTYQPSDVVSISNGSMNFHVHTVHGVHVVAAALPVISGAHGSEGGLLYGRYMIRIRADAVPGYKASLLLWPDSEQWPKDGEIDFPEVVELAGPPIYAFVHYQDGQSPVDQAGFQVSQTLTPWHTATITWLPDKVEFQLDDHVIGTVSQRIPNTPMHAIIQVETRTDGPVPSDRAAGNVQIAWLAVFTPSCNPRMSVAPAKAACKG